MSALSRSALAHAAPSDPPADPLPLAVDAKRLAQMLGLSVRTIRAMDCAGKLPRPLRFGHAVRWNFDDIRSWLTAGAPDRRMWEALKGGARV